MKKIALTLITALVAFNGLRADEGMWLPVLVPQYIDKMQANGFKLGAEDIYSINQASLKDAVVLFGGGCTGELVSSQGLLLTNHHCGYSYIQRHSSVEHDYLKDGFWAMSKEEELVNPGLSVSFLDRMEDVSAKVLEGITDDMDENARTEAIRNNMEAVRKAALEGQPAWISASVESLFYGNQYFLFIYKRYNDVRLVGAPPSSIGKFGGETDNWMWPRHTGDFSIFRVYADKDNNPSAPSKDNVPFQPRKFFKISRAGVNPGDFTFIYGFPGSTNEYITSEAIRYISEYSDPAKVALRTLRLNVFDKYMSQDQAVRIQYSSKKASVANAWKKWQGEALGINKAHTVATRQAFEGRFEEWAKGGKYQGLSARINDIHKEVREYRLAYDYVNESLGTLELLTLWRTVNRALSNNADVAAAVSAFYKDYYEPIDREAYKAVMKVYFEKVPSDFIPEYLKKLLASKGSVDAMVDFIFNKTIFTNRTKVEALTPNKLKSLEKDPVVMLAKATESFVGERITAPMRDCNSRIALLMRDYMKAQMEFQPEKVFYPDANLTLRVAFGKVGAYKPADAISYHHVSTLKGIMEKDNPDIFDYNIPQVLRDIYAQGGYEDVPVCFIASNHTTGGNSGSPVINADGNLIGINFDRVWEGTMSDVAFNPEICRNISLDIRYLLFIVDKIGGASHLFNEMEFVD